MHTDEAFLIKMISYLDDDNLKQHLERYLPPEQPDTTDFELQLERLQRETQRLEAQMAQEEREFAIQEQFLAEIALERVNLGGNYRVNWLEEGF